MAEKLYSKIGDVANQFGVNTSLIRYWEQEFSFISPKKNNKGTRYYTSKDIDSFALIHHLVKEKGMTIQGVKNYISHSKESKSLEKLEVIVTLKKTRELLSDIKDVLINRSSS